MSKVDRAIVDVLTGAASPGGKLPISYPRSSGQIPIFYGHKVSGGRSHWKGAYVDESNEPLYPFGHGLGYSTFTIATEGAAPPSVALDDTVEVSALVTNTGNEARTRWCSSTPVTRWHRSRAPYAN